MPEYRQILNNYLQANRVVGQVRYEYESIGPSSNAIWTAIALLDEVEHGRGVARTKGEAAEIAAERVLNALNVPH